MSELQPIPNEIVREVARLDHVGGIWKWAEFRSGRKSYFKAWEDLTIADCEQLAEQYARLARKSIERFRMRGGSPHTAKTAGHYVHRARLYRDRYHELLGKPPNERDQVFPILSVEEVKSIEQEASQQ
jgi:hypothetical protein